MLQDLRYALRTLAKSPGFTLVAVLTLALGAGANSLLFSVIHAVLLRPLPYPQSDRIVSVAVVPRDQSSARMLGAQVSHWSYLQWRNESRSFAELTAYRPTAAVVGAGPAVEDVQGAEVTADFFPLFGVQPVLGRAFTGDEQLAHRAAVVLLSDGLWRTRFGGDPAIVGRTVRMDGQPVVVIGVLPAGFDFPRGVRFWAPMSPLPTSGGKTMTTLFLNVVGRLAPGGTITQARTELTGLSARSKGQSPEYLGDAAVDVVTLHERLYGSARPLLLILLGVVGFVLLIACANVASLLVARAASRGREFAIRAALGAGRLRLARQLLAESIVLAVLGAAAGLLVPVLGLRWFMHAAPLRAVEAVDVHLDATVLAFTTALALLTGVAFGLAPAVAASRANLTVELKNGSGQAGVPAHRGRLRKGLVVVELAAALVLLVGAGLLTRSLFQLLAVDLGYRSDHLVGLYPGGRSKSWFLQDKARGRFYDGLRDRLAALPGIASVAIGYAPPLGVTTMRSTIGLDGVPPGSRGVSVRVVSANFFQTLETTMIAGRDFTPADRADAPLVAIVNAAFAREYLHGSDPVGHRLFVVGGTRTIVGEVKDMRQFGRDLPAGSEVFIPAFQGDQPPSTFILRTKGNPAALLGTIARAVQEVDSEPAHIFTLEGELSKAAAPRRDSAILLAAFAGVALLLVAVGLAGLIAYLVAYRTHEIGVGVALGAGRVEVLRLVVGEGVRLVAIGITIGLIGAAAATRVLANKLYGVTPLDPVTFVIVPLVLAAVVLGAAIVPARRATKVDPIVALRYE